MYLTTLNTHPTQLAPRPSPSPDHTTGLLSELHFFLIIDHTTATTAYTAAAASPNIKITYSKPETMLGISGTPH